MMPGTIRRSDVSNTAEQMAYLNLNELYDKANCFSFVKEINQALRSNITNVNSHFCLCVANETKITRNKGGVKEST